MTGHESWLGALLLLAILFVAFLKILKGLAFLLFAALVLYALAASWGMGFAGPLLEVFMTIGILWLFLSFLGRCWR
jgi:hypothetical protein